ncbi:MAG: hypothetical protein IJR85_08805 [Synergistaceae bacterium]|nr:hypothetical protein [Synergistaceae bacterium]
MSNISHLYHMHGQIQEEQSEIETKQNEMNRKLIFCVTDENLRESKNELAGDIETIRNFILSHFDED